MHQEQKRKSYLFIYKEGGWILLYTKRKRRKNTKLVTRRRGRIPTLHKLRKDVVSTFKPLQCLSNPDHYRSARSSRTPPAIFAIGSSLIDVGTNAILNSSTPGNGPFNGIDCDPPVPSGRLSNCYVVADFVAMALGYDESPPPFLAVVNSSDVFDRARVTVGQQIDQFAGVVRPRLIALLGRVAAGNFLAQSFFLLATGSTLYALGGRVFGIVAPPLIGCSPLYYEMENSGGECDARANLLSLGVYKLLASALGVLRLTHPDFRPTSTLCGNRDEYFFWNQFLLTSEGSRLQVAACFGRNPRYWTPISFTDLKD
ncbi:unnamed protein product [Linum tenue]|uniref:Uncharacterized protein n=1 Tax=Linum tenue TaxID=586396 RepID=A0AAV0RGJ8_9ROSI|nr:unnamed protein product [Linum tenue]